MRSIVQDSYKRDNLSRLVVQLVRNVFVVCDQICNVDIAVVLFREDVLPNLISDMGLAPHTMVKSGHQPVFEGALDVKLEDKVDQLLLDLATIVVPARSILTGKNTS